MVSFFDVSAHLPTRSDSSNSDYLLHGYSSPFQHFTGLAYPWASTLELPTLISMLRLYVHLSMRTS